MPSELGVTPEQFLEDFAVWARTQAESWGVLMPEGAITVAELIEQDGLEREPSAEDFARWASRLPGHAQVVEIAARLAVPAGTRQVGPEAVPLLEAWAEAAPVAEEPHRLLARFYLDQESPEMQSRAVAHLEFLDARAQYTPAYAAALAKRYAETGEKALAVRKAERAVSIAPYDADQRELAARVTLVAGLYESTQRHLEALAMIEPDRALHGVRLERVRELIKAGK